MKVDRIATNVLGTTTNIKSNNKVCPKTIEKSAPASASSALDSAGRAMVAMGKTEKKEIVNPDKILIDVQEYVKNLDDPIQKAKAKDLIKAIKKAIEKKEFDNLNYVQDALEVLNKGKKYKTLETYAKKLSKKYSENGGIYTKNALNELLETFFDEKIETRVDDDGKVLADVAGCGSFSARAKGADSVLSKLRNKVIDLKEAVPKNEVEAGYLIGDAQGIRLNLDPLDFSGLNDAQLSKKVDEIVDFYKKGNTAKNITIDELEKNKAQFPDFIRGEKVDSKAEKLFLEALSYSQTQPYIEKLCQAIKSGKIRITEINNYSAKDGVPYLNSTQVEKIKEAYEIWYKSTKVSGANGYEIFNKDTSEEYMFQNGVKFKADLPIISTTINDTSSEKFKKAIKANGYTAAQFNLVSQDGFQEEFQLRGKAVDKIAESEHIVYDVKSEKDTVLHPIYDKIKATINKLKEKDENLDCYNKYYREVFMAQRKQELGIKATVPNLKDYVNFDNLDEEDYKLLDITGINALHEKVEEMKEQKQL